MTAAALDTQPSQPTGPGGHVRCRGFSGHHTQVTARRELLYVRPSARSLDSDRYIARRSRRPREGAPQRRQARSRRTADRDRDWPRPAPIEHLPERVENSARLQHDTEWTAGAPSRSQLPHDEIRRLPSEDNRVGCAETARRASRHSRRRAFRRASAAEGCTPRTWRCCRRTRNRRAGSRADGGGAITSRTGRSSRTAAAAARRSPIGCVPEGPWPDRTSVRDRR